MTDRNEQVQNFQRMGDRIAGGLENMVRLFNPLTESMADASPSERKDLIAEAGPRFQQCVSRWLAAIDQLSASISEYARYADPPQSDGEQDQNSDC